MQKLLLAAAAIAGLGMGLPAAFAQTTAPAGTTTTDTAPMVQAQNGPASSWSRPANDAAAGTNTFGRRGNGIPYSQSNPYAYHIPGG